MAEPYPKSRQLARGERRYRRKIASPKQWQAIWAEKVEGKPCRLACYGCLTRSQMEAHHIVPRGAPYFGDDVEDNIVPLCSPHHARITEREPKRLRSLAESLSDAEYAYVVGKLGEGAMGRLFGVGV